MDKQRDGEYRRTLSAESRPFVAFQANKEKSTILTKRNKNKSQPDSRLKNTVTMDLPDNYSVYKKEEKLSADAWINQWSVHNIERPVKLILIEQLSMTLLIQQKLPRIQIPVMDGSQPK